MSGGRMPDTPHDRMAFSMPEFSMLSDADIAEVVNYVRNSWTNQASEVTVDDVVKMRHFLRIKPRVVPTCHPNSSPRQAKEDAKIYTCAIPGTLGRRPSRYRATTRHKRQRTGGLQSCKNQHPAQAEIQLPAGQILKFNLCHFP